MGAEADKMQKAFAGRLTELANVTARSLNSVTEESVARLQVAQENMELGLKNSTEQYQKQLADISVSHLEEFHSHMDGALRPFLRQLQETMQAFEEKARKEVAEYLQSSTDKMVGALVNRLQMEAEEATRLFHGMRANELDAQLRQITEKLIEDSATQLHKLAGDSLDLASARLNEKAEQVVRQAVESFRNKIAKMLSVFEPDKKEIGET
jgi:phosphoserine phosphatase